MNWRPCDESFDDPLMQAMTNLIVPHEQRHPDLLPNLRTDSQLVLASDYSGEHSESPFQVITYLLATDESIFVVWNPVRRSIREHFLTDGRRFAFKSLNDQSKQKAVVPFLRSVDDIDGVLVSIAIHKAIEPFAKMHSYDDATSKLWKPEVWEKLLRVGHFGAILVGGLSKAGQVIRWMMDDDAMIANERLQITAGNVISTMFARTCQMPYGLRCSAFSGQSNSLGSGGGGEPSHASEEAFSAYQDSSYLHGGVPPRSGSNAPGRA